VEGVRLTAQRRPVTPRGRGRLPNGYRGAWRGRPATTPRAVTPR